MMVNDMFKGVLPSIVILLAAVFPLRVVQAEPKHSPRRDQIVSHEKLRKVLQAVVAEKNGGFGLHMWATVVDREGVVQTVVFSGNDRADQWRGSRAVSAQKANTAGAFSLDHLALSTANLYTATQPGGSLFGLPFSNPVDPDVAYRGPTDTYGQPNDPMVGRVIGGINVFGGGLPLYNSAGKLVGGLGVSGDSSCADHNIAWKVRHALNLDHVPDGVSTTGDDNIVYDIVDGTSKDGWGHPQCADGATRIGNALPQTHPIGTDP